MYSSVIDIIFPAPWNILVLPTPNLLVFPHFLTSLCQRSSDSSKCQITFRLVLLLSKKVDLKSSPSAKRTFDRTAAWLPATSTSRSRERCHASTSYTPLDRCGRMDWRMKLTSFTKRSTMCSQSPSACRWRVSRCLPSVRECLDFLWGRSALYFNCFLYVFGIVHIIGIIHNRYRT